MQSTMFAQPTDGNFIAGFIFVTVAYIVLMGLLLQLFKKGDYRYLLVMGLITAIAAMAYNTCAFGPVLMLTPTLMKIAILLVLSGLASHLIGPLNATSDSTSSRVNHPAASGSSIIHESAEPTHE